MKVDASVELYVLGCVESQYEREDAHAIPALNHMGLLTLFGLDSIGIIMKLFRETSRHTARNLM